MKHFLPTFALLLSLPVLADKTISLKAGSSVDIDGTLVTCVGTSDQNLPKCWTRQSFNSDYEVMVGSSIWGKVSGFDAALKAVLQLKTGGLCS